MANYACHKYLYIRMQASYQKYPRPMHSRTHVYRYKTCTVTYVQESYHKAPYTHTVVVKSLHPKAV